MASMDEVKATNNNVSGDIGTRIKSILGIQENVVEAERSTGKGRCRYSLRKKDLGVIIL